MHTVNTYDEFIRLIGSHLTNGKVGELNELFFKR
jgi:hypothetical protein